MSKKVKVTGALYEYWYRNYVGEEFDVIGEGTDSSGDKYYIVVNEHLHIDSRKDYCIAYYHCEVIE